jgi:protein-tyrosine phosphatase
MPPGRIDIHAHLLPGIDDGCPSLDDSLACARLFAAAGYTHLTCTPHVWPQLPGNTVASIRQRTQILNTACHDAHIPITLLPGGELNLEWYWPQLQSFPRDQIPTYGLLGKHLLFDFWSDTLPKPLLTAIDHFHSLGFTLIMAHPERIAAFQRDPALLASLERRGLLLQCNSWCLMDRPGTPTRGLSERLLRDGRYFLLGTDTHNARTLQVRLDGIQRAIDLIGEPAVHTLTHTHPASLFTPTELTSTPP